MSALDDPAYVVAFGALALSGVSPLALAWYTRRQKKLDKKELAAERAEDEKKHSQEKREKEEIAAKALEIAQSLMTQAKSLNADTRESFTKLANGVQAINTDRVLRNLFAIIVVTTGPNGGIITYASDLVYKITGYQPNELVGKNIEMMLPPEIIASHKYFRMAYEANPSSRPMGPDREVTLVHKDGSRIRVWLGLDPDRVSNPENVTAVIIPLEAGYGEVSESRHRV